MKITRNIFVLFAAVCLSSSLFISCSPDSAEEGVYNIEVQNVDEDDQQVEKG
ncbi:hypothetical protein GTQ40_01755 [Flavobacteriaceae bacterium R38]|nr:hypothetical protein [Flavobacteriaceae bacterium R38]